MLKSEVINPLAMQTPFAINGNKNIPNQTAGGTETSSIDLGFLPITQEALDDGGQAPERIDFNGMFYLSTDLRVFLQNGGFITFNPLVSSAIGGYPQDAILGYINQYGQIGFVRSLKDNNTLNFVQNPNYIDNVNWSFSHILNIDSDINTVNTNITNIQTNLQNQIITNKNNITSNTNSINNLNSQVVKISGNQTISGTKTFSGVIKVPNSTTTGTALALRALYHGTISDRPVLMFGTGDIIQYGQTSAYTGQWQSKTISLRIPFSANNSYVVITNWVGSANVESSNVDDNLLVTNQTASSFTLTSTERGSNDGTWNIKANWIAIGY